MSIFGAFNPVSSSNNISQSDADYNQRRAVDREAHGWRNAMAQQAAEYERALAIRDAEIVGFIEQKKWLLVELERLDPNNALLQPSSRQYTDGKPVRNLGMLWIKAFDDFIRKKLPGNPAQYRNSKLK